MSKFTFRQMLAGWGTAVATIAIGVYLFGAEKVWGGIEGVFRFVTGMSGTPAVAAVALLALGACTVPDRADFDTDEAYQQAVQERASRLSRIERLSDAGHAFAKSQVEVYRALDVDVVLLSEEQQNLARAACGTMIGLTEAVRAFQADPLPTTEVAEEAQTVAEAAELALSDDALNWCVGVVDTLGQNLPDPEPDPEPASMLMSGLSPTKPVN